MRSYLLLVFVVLFIHQTSAQKVTVRGQLTDTTGLRLPSATVMIVSPKDSTLVNFGVTNVQGIFEIRNVNRGEHLLKISFVGYATLYKKFKTTDDAPVTDLGLVKL